MLSAMTKDQVTHAAVQKLIVHGLTPEKIANMDVTKIQDLIYPVGFFKVKMKVWSPYSFSETLFFLSYNNE